jgi:hypothetical protein
MSKISNQKTMREFDLGSKPDRTPTTRSLGNDIGIVDAEVDLFIYNLGKTEGFGEVKTGVVDEAVGWIIFLYL